MSAPTPTKTTIFIWPTGLFPRRIIYLLRAKSLTLSHLQKGNIQLVPVQLTPQGLVSHPDFEARPEGSLPAMRLEYGDDDGTEQKKVVWIRESLSILSYLDDLFPSPTHPSLAGSTPVQRARCTDVLSALSDTVMWGIVAMAHSNPATTSWSGLKEEEMAPTAAAHAERKVKALMGKMDGWVRENMAGGSGSLAGPGVEVTFADVALMAHVEYMREVYGMEMIEGYEALKGWWEGMRGEGWVVGREKLLECEKSGKWEGVLGK